LKRQVEQITALAGEDKKAGIRVADALRKRKLRASLKDVKIREPADVQRRLTNSGTWGLAPIRTIIHASPKYSSGGAQRGYTLARASYAAQPTGFLS